VFDVSSHEPVNSTRFFEIVHPEDREAVREAIGNALQGGLNYGRSIEWCIGREMSGGSLQGVESS
jgi:hypothetical protein